jgi:hypothetical protein
MATYDGCQVISGIAGSAVTVYRLVSLAADGAYDHTGASARPDGIAAETVAAAATLPLVVPTSVKCKVEAGGAISVGDRLVSDANGKVVANANPGLGNYWAGIAVTAAAADGEVIEMLFSVDQDQVA